MHSHLDGRAKSENGFAMLAPVLILVYGVTIGFHYQAYTAATILAAAGLFLCLGFRHLKPNQSCRISCFGRDRGVLTASGFRWINPLYSVANLADEEHHTTELGTGRVIARASLKH